MIHGMMIVRNEIERPLNNWEIYKRVLKVMDESCDHLTIIDDNSTDTTVEYTEEFLDREIIKNNTRLWDVDESKLRQILWSETLKNVKHNDWILCLDADEYIPFSPLHLRFFLNNTLEHIDGIGFTLYDMWEVSKYREDDFWKAHYYPWCMAIRYDEKKKYSWGDKKLHCGRFPLNSSQAMLPTKMPIFHYGWAMEEERKIKYERYKKADPKGKYGIIGQYESILDENPNLISWAVDTI